MSICLVKPLFDHFLDSLQLFSLVLLSPEVSIFSWLLKAHDHKGLNMDWE